MLRRSKYDKSEEENWCDTILRYGRCICRNADPFSLPRFVINTGIEMEAEEEDEEEDGSPLCSVEGRIWRSSYMRYKQCFPELVTTLVNPEEKSYISKDRVERLVSDLQIFRVGYL